MKYNLTSQSLLRCLFFCLSTFLFLSGFAQEQLDLQVMTSNVFRSNNFKAIGVGKNGYLWAGTQNSGLYKYNGTVWKEFGGLANNNINDIKTDFAGGIWIAQSGYNGGQAITGGIDYFPDTSFSYTFYTTFDGLPTRYVRSLYVNTSGSSLIGAIWSAHLGNITGGVSSSGCVARGIFDLPLTPFRKITTGVDISNGLGSVQAIGGNSTEVWAFAVNNFGHNQILRYKYSDGTFLGYYDDTNSSLPAGIVVRSIYFDSKDRVWIGTFNGGVYVYDKGTFHQLVIPSVLTETITVNVNALTGDSQGNIYLGTFSGLVMFNGSDYTDANAFTLYTTANGLPSNNVQSIAIDYITNNPYNRILATDNGIVRWKFGPSDSLTVSGTISYIADGSLEPKPDISLKPFEGVTVSATGLPSTITDEDGLYSLKVPKGYSGTITPSYKNFIFFRPNTIALDNVTEDEELDSIIYNPALVVPEQITNPLPSPSFPLAHFIKQNHFSLPGYPDSPCPYDALPAPWYGWKFWQRGNCPRDGITGGHIENNVLGADDRFAWDCNISNPKQDLDKGQNIYAPADGIIMTNADFPGWGNDGAAQLLIQHITPAGIWYSGYKHMKLEENIKKAKSSTDIDSKRVTAGQKLGVVSNVGTNKNHLHFILYYEDPFAPKPKKLRSVDKADGQIIPRIVPATDEYFHFSGSVVSGAQLMIKRDSVWYEYGTSDENGNLQVLFMPAVKQGDSIKIIAAGYEEITLPVDSASITGSNVIIPLMPSSTPSSKIKYARVVSLDQKTFYDSPTAHLKVTGQNISAYDVIQEIDLGDSLITQTILSNKSSADSIITITLTETGSNVYRFVFKGVDTVHFYKNFDYIPDTKDFYNITLAVPNNLYGSKLYVDGAFIKNLIEAAENISLLTGEHVVNVRTEGYKDTTFQVTTSATYNLSLVAESYIQPDSIVFNFPENSRIQYYNKMTGLDSARKTIVSIRQSMDDFSGMGLIPKSRTFKFTHLNDAWSGMRFVTVLDQQERLSNDSIYLLRIYNDTSFTKIPFSANDMSAKYDSAEQKLSYDFIDFKKGSALKESLVIMEKQAPVIKALSDLTINADTSLSIPLSQIFADPDSVRNDVTYHLLDTTPTGLYLSLKGDSLLINTEKSYTGTTSITIVAEHDSLLATKTIKVTIVSGTLPITLLNFSGSVVQNQVLLNWQTAQEINTSHFVIERSSNGNTFSSIGQVSAISNSTSTKTYSFKDQTHISNNVYYRLKIVDVDGKYIYSNTIVIKPDNYDIAPSYVFPNPVHNNLQIQLNGHKGNVSLRVYDFTGRKVSEQKLSADGNLSFTINTKALPAGAYLIKIDSKNKKENISFIKE